MLRSTTMHTIRDLAAQGHSIRAIADEVGVARNTVRKYLRGTPEAVPHPPRGSKLDPFKDQIRRWVQEDRLLNCATMLERLRPLGYTGKVSTIKDFVQPLRPPRAGKQPVRRYETTPGEQMQIDWGEFLYTEEGRTHKLYGFTAVLSYSRMRFVTFSKRCDTPILLRSIMAACEYFEGLPTIILADRMKSVLLQMDGRTPRWNPRYADFLAALGVVPRVCRARTPQTKGKVERSIGVVKSSFWPGVCFTDVADLNGQAAPWCDRRNSLPHQTTRVPPVDRWVEEGLRPLPHGFAWERFRLEDRKVTWDGFVSYDGVLYGIPATPPLAGQTVQVSVQRDQLTVWRNGAVVVTHPVRPVSGTMVLHPEQFAQVPTAHAAQQPHVPLGHLVQPVLVAQRPLSEYDQLCGVRTEVAA